MHCNKFAASSIDIAKFFEPAIKEIIKAIEEQTRKTTTKIRVRSKEIGRVITHSLTYRLSLWLEASPPPIICFPNWRIISG